MKMHETSNNSWATGDHFTKQTLLILLILLFVADIAIMFILQLANIGRESTLSFMLIDSILLTLIVVLSLIALLYRHLSGSFSFNTLLELGVAPTSLIILCSKLIIMLVIDQTLSSIPIHFSSFIDAIFLTLLAGPFLYLWVLQPINVIIGNTPVLEKDLTLFRIKSGFISVLLTLGLLATIGYVILIDVITRQESGAMVINIAGRQRMLSQRIVLLSNQLDDARDTRIKSEIREKLGNAINLMRQSHNTLAHGNTKLGVLPPATEGLKKLYFGSTKSIDRDVMLFLELAEEHLQEAKDRHIGNNGWKEHLHNSPDELLQNLNAIVSQYQLENEGQIDKLQQAQILLFITTLIVLILSGLMVLRPIVQKLEQSTQKLHEKNKSISLMENIAAIANESDNIDETIETCLNTICAYMGWPIGHYCTIVNDVTDYLVSTELWHLDYPERFEVFRKVTKGTQYAPGIGLPGRVLSSGKPLWITDVTLDDNFPRARQAESTGVKAALAFPIKIDKKVFGVLEFFSENTIEPDQHTLEIMSYIGVQLGRVIERKEAEKEFQKLSRAVESSSSSIIITNLDGVIEYINPKFTEVTGFKWDEAIGKKPNILKSGETPEAVYVELWKTIASGREWKGEICNRKNDGSLYWARNSITGVKDTKGNITHYIGVQDDVSHEHEMTE